MAAAVDVEMGMDRSWLEAQATDDPVSHAYALWDLDHAQDRVEFRLARRRGVPRAYLLIWKGLPASPVVHWVGTPAATELLPLLPPRPVVVIGPPAIAPKVSELRSPARTYPLSVMERPAGSPPLREEPAIVRRLTRLDRDELAAFAVAQPDLLASTYRTADPGLEPIWGAFLDGQLVGASRAPVTLPAVWVLSGIFVDPGHRSRGFGRAVTAAASAAAESAGARPVLYVRSDNRPARRAYEAIGFRVIDRKTWIDAGADRAP